MLARVMTEMATGHSSPVALETAGRFSGDGVSFSTDSGTISHASTVRPRISFVSVVDKTSSQQSCFSPKLAR